MFRPRATAGKLRTFTLRVQQRRLMIPKTFTVSSTYNIRSMDKPDGVIDSSFLQTIRLAPRPRNLPRVVGAFF